MKLFDNPDFYKNIMNKPKKYYIINQRKNHLIFSSYDFQEIQEYIKNNLINVPIAIIEE